jgi:transcriptional regulator with XRE-family HTH domain
MESVGDRLRRAREAAKLSQEALAQKIGVTRSAIAQVEGGISNSLNAENLARAAQALRKSSMWLATGQGAEHPTDILTEVLGHLPNTDQREILDYILYKVERATVPYAAQNGASYATMIEALKADFERLRSTPEGESNPPPKPHM